MTSEVSMKELIESGLSPRETDRLIPQIIKNPHAMGQIKAMLLEMPTRHKLIVGDARNMNQIKGGSVHLIVTSPPYWTLKEYNSNPNQLGEISDYIEFLDNLDKVWSECYRVLAPGGRLVVVVGDVCLSRRKVGKHSVVPLHSDIQVRCRNIGFDNLAPILWYKIANAKFEAEGNGNGFLGKPYEPNCIVKNDVEYILMERKSGSYRSPDVKSRLLSVISKEDHKVWFQQIWTDVKGESTRNHPAPFPEELAMRLVRMFSFVGDTVLDPFCGTGTTLLAGMKSGRNSIGIEIDKQYAAFAAKRLQREASSLHMNRKLEIVSELRPST